MTQTQPGGASIRASARPRSKARRTLTQSDDEGRSTSSGGSGREPWGEPSAARATPGRGTGGRKDRHVGPGLHQSPSERPGGAADDEQEQEQETTRGTGTGNLRAIRADSGHVPLEDLYRGRTRLALIRDLAMGEWSPREIALQLGATEESVRAFQGDHADEISEVRAALAGHLAIETAGLWVAKKQNRLAEYQQDIEDLSIIVEAMRAQGVSRDEDAILGGLGTRRHHNLMKTKLALLRAVADELSPRMGVTFTPSNEDEDSKTVRYVIEASEFRDDLT